MSTRVALRSTGPRTMRSAIACSRLSELLTSRRSWPKQLVDLLRKKVGLVKKGLANFKRIARVISETAPCLLSGAMYFSTRSFEGSLSALPVLSTILASLKLRETTWLPPSQPLFYYWSLAGLSSEALILGYKDKEKACCDWTLHPKLAREPCR